LLNHPLDCPICDQGGECDLQDLTMTYGNDRGRLFHSKDLKRSVNDTNCNEFIKFTLTRCIHCSRCIRFLNEFAGDFSLGMLGRGKQSEIGLYIDNFLNTELQSNIVDLCPVGALTSKVYSFRYRSWENNYTESIDITDSLCSPIRVFIQENKILRILPEYNETFNFNFLTEKARFVYSYLNIQRLNAPMAKVRFLALKNNNFFYKFISISWLKLNKILNKFYLILFNNNKKNYWVNKTMILFKPIIGNSIDLELSFLIKLNTIKNQSFCFNATDNALLTNFYEIGINFDKRFNYILNPFIFNDINFCLLLNINLRLNHTLLNSKIRQEYVWKNLLVYCLGVKFNLTYKYFQISNSMKKIYKFMEGRLLINNLILKKKCLILYGTNLVNNINSICLYFIRNFLPKISNKIFPQYLIEYCGRVGALDIG
jgi:NADH dehydrogenase/NADH:ubiquinone oxidoreductase subunit G